LTAHSWQASCRHSRLGTWDSLEFHPGDKSSFIPACVVRYRSWAGRVLWRRSLRKLLFAIWTCTWIF